MDSGTELAGRYRLESPLGRGGLGEVWRGRDLREDREVAVRVMLAAAVGPGDARRLRRDAECAAGLRHPGIAAVFDVGEHEGRLFIVSELLPGRDLAALLSDHPGGLPVSQALAIGAAVAAALAHAHGEGIVHRDLRPPKIFVGDEGEARVRDFGIARDLNAASSVLGAGQFPGAPAYLAPELWAGEPVTGSADLYALGCILYQLLTGQLPFQGPSLPALIHRHLTEVPVAPRDRRPEVPVALSDLVTALLAKAPENRPPDAAAAAAALTGIRDSGRRPRPRAAPAPSCPPLACTSAAEGVIDVHAVNPAGQVRRCAGAAGGAGPRWGAWDDLPPWTTGKVTALASASCQQGVYVAAVIDGVPFMNEGLAGWREILGSSPLRLPVADVAIPSAPAGAVSPFDGVTAYVLDDDGAIWSSRAPLPLPAPAAGQFATGRFGAIAACAWDRSNPVLLAATADAVWCRYWWAGTREFRWWQLPLNTAGPPITDVACVSLAAKRVEAFVLYADGGIWHSSLRLAQEGTLDWSTWVTLLVPPGQVTAISACQFGPRDGAVVAVTGDGELYFSAHAIQVTRTGLSRWSAWSRVTMRASA